MPLFFSKPDTGSGDDNGAWTIARSDKTVRTAAPIGDFQKVSQGQLAREKQELERMKEYLKRFNELIAIRLQREQLDSEATKALQNYQAELGKVLVEKQAAVAAKHVELQKLRLPQARMQQTIADTRQRIDQQIAEMQKKQKDIASNRGWDS